MMQRRGAQAVSAHQPQKAVLSRLRPEAVLLDRRTRRRTDRRRRAPSAPRARNAPARSRIRACARAGARNVARSRRSRTSMRSSSGNWWVCAQEMPRVGLVMAHEAQQRRAIALPVVLAQCAGGVRLQSELPLDIEVIAWLMCGKICGARVVQRVVQIEDPRALPPRSAARPEQPPWAAASSVSDSASDTRKRKGGEPEPKASAL